MRKFTAGEIWDIRRSYGNAANPRKQIEILSELYACTPEEIREALGEPQSPQRRAEDSGDQPAKAESGLRHRWTTEEEQRVISLYGAGMADDKIAAAVGLRANQVRDRIASLRKAGRLAPPADSREGRGLPEEGDAPQRCRRRRWAQEEVTRLIAMYGDGMPIDAIAGELGMEKRVVENEIAKLKNAGVVPRSGRGKALRAAKTGKEPAPPASELDKVERALTDALRVIHALRSMAEGDA